MVSSDPAATTYDLVAGAGLSVSLRDLGLPESALDAAAALVVGETRSESACRRRRLRPRHARRRVARRATVRPGPLSDAWRDWGARRQNSASSTPRNSAAIAERALNAPHTASPVFVRLIECRNAASPEKIATTTFTMSVRP